MPMLPMQGLDPAGMGASPAPAPAAPSPLGGQAPMVEETAPRLPFNQNEDGGTTAPPDQQSIYEKFVAAAAMIIWDRKSAPKFVDALRQSPDPKETAADISASVAFRVLQGAAQAGTPIPSHIALAGGQEIATQVVELADRAGVKLGPKDAEEIYYMGVDKARVMAQGAGLIDQEAVKQDASTIDQMGQDGRLEQAMQLMQSDRQRHYEHQPLEDKSVSPKAAKNDMAKQGRKIIGLED